MRLQRAAALALIIFAGGCKDRPRIEPAEATPAPVAEGLIAGTPEGDLTEWATDVRAGLATAAGDLESDRAAVQKRVLDLYVTRQEYMEMYYGPTGRMQPEPALSEAVKTAEDRFHELMILSGATPPAASAKLRSAIAALDAQLAIVLERRERSARHVRGETR